MLSATAVPKQCSAFEGQGLGSRRPGRLPEKGKSPKVFWGRVQMVFSNLDTAGSKGLPRVFCTTQNLYCTGACPFRTSARGLLLAGSKNLLHPLINRGRKNSININFLVRISRGHSRPLRPDDPGSKSFSPPPWPQENAIFGADVHDFRHGRP